MSQYFPKSFGSFGRNIKVDISNYATKADIKTISHVDISSLALKTNLANLKTEVEKLDIDTVPTDLSKLSHVVKKYVVKKDVYNKFVAKVDNINTSGFVLKTKYDTDKSELENKIPDTIGPVKKTDYDAKITNIEGKIPDVSNLTTKTALTTVENKIPDVGNLVKKTNYNTKVTEIENTLNNHNHDKYIDTSESNKLAVDVFNARLAQTNLVTKTAFDNTVSNLDNKIEGYKTLDTLLQRALKGLRKPELRYFKDKNRFEEDGTQNYLTFQPLNKYLTLIGSTKYILSWKYKGLSNETIKPIATSDNIVTSLIDYYTSKT